MAGEAQSCELQCFFQLATSVPGHRVQRCAFLRIRQASCSLAFVPEPGALALHSCFSSWEGGLSSWDCGMPGFLTRSSLFSGSQSSSVLSRRFPLKMAPSQQPPRLYEVTTWGSGHCWHLPEESVQFLWGREPVLWSGCQLAMSRAAWLTSPSVRSSAAGVFGLFCFLGTTCCFFCTLVSYHTAFVTFQSLTVFSPPPPNSCPNFSMT